MSSLTAVYFTEMRMLEKDDHKSEDYKRNHHLWWGKSYRAAEIKPIWRTPTDDDIDMAFDLLNLADEAVTKINNLMESRSVGDNVWSNEFCRAINVIDKLLRGSYNLYAEIPSLKTGGLQAESYVIVQANSR